MIKQRNCKQCNKLFSPHWFSAVNCSYDCIKLGRKTYLKDYRRLNTKPTPDYKKIRMPKYEFNDNKYNWDEIN